MTEQIEGRKFSITNPPKTTYEAVRQDLSDVSTDSLVRLIIDCEHGIERGLREGVRGLDGINYGPAIDGNIETMMRNAQQTLVRRVRANLIGGQSG